MAIRCVSKAVILKNGSVLLNKCKHEDGNIYYSLPGGGQNPYETIEQAVVREVKEETGYDISVNEFIALVEEIYANIDLREKFPEYTHRITHIFKASLVDSKKDEPTEKDFEMEESVWIPLTKAEQLTDTCSPWLINILLNLEKGNIPIYLGTEYIK
ncbi:MAG: NUDIX domain-containing protein [Oscillospiraceae bacterium]|nr:NUDIX domain-containing protein [Oscillospiraceae bacterium]